MPAGGQIPRSRACYNHKYTGCSKNPLGASQPWSYLLRWWQTPNFCCLDPAKFAALIMFSSWLKQQTCFDLSPICRLKPYCCIFITSLFGIYHKSPNFSYWSTTLPPSVFLPTMRPKKFASAWLPGRANSFRGLKSKRPKLEIRGLLLERHPKKVCLL